MHRDSRPVWHALREHATFWVIGGMLLAVTGFAPEEWLARAVEGLHVPDNVLHLWAAGVDVRVVPIAVGVAIIGVGLLRQHRAFLLSTSGGPPVPSTATVGAPSVKAESAPKSAEQPIALLTPEALPLPEEPSLAVLPFQNMSGDPEQEYFSDGMTEELITALSHVRWLFVIARNSSFAYKGNSPDIRQVGRELGVRYVLEGSVRHAGNRVRIAGQLIDTGSGTHIWADRFDGDMADIFDLQDQVTTSVVAAIEPKLRAAEIERARRKPTANLQAYDLFLRALPSVRSIDRAVIEQAIALLERAIALDPDYARALALQARLQSRSSVVGGADPADPSVTGSVRRALLAVEKGRDDPEVLWTAAFAISFVGGDLRGGIALIDRSLALNPHSSEALATSSLVRAFMGDRATAIAHAERALRLNPTGPDIHHIYQARGMLDFGDADYEGCCNWVAQALRELPDFPQTLRYQAASLGLLGRHEEAREAIGRLRAVCPDDTIARVRMYFAFLARLPETSRTLDALLEGLRRAGLPEA